MSRVLIPAQSDWYHELKSVSYYGESDLEQFIREHLTSLFPNHYVFPFKKEVTSKTSGEVKKPDLAMVKHDYSDWGVIEVELSEHNLKHVLSQTRVFADGDYNGPEIAEYARGQILKHCSKRVPLTRLKSLISDSLPRILVIADADLDRWETELKGENVDVCVFQIFKNTKGSHIFRVMGDYPIASTQEVHCRRHPTISNMLELGGPFTFRNVNKNKEVHVLFETCLTRWGLVEDHGKLYLQFLGKSNPLSPVATYALIADRQNNYYFRIN